MEASGVGEEGKLGGGTGGGGRPVQYCTAIGSEKALRQHPTLGVGHAIG